MRLITTLLALGLTTTGALAAETTCKAQATDKKLAGAALTSFMKKCESDASKACGSSAAEKKLAGAAKTSFTKKCVTDAVGTQGKTRARRGPVRPRSAGDRAAQGLQQATPGNVLGQLFHAHAGLDPAHVGLAQHQLVQGDVMRRAQHDLGHEVLRDGRAARLSLALQPVTKTPSSSPFPSKCKPHRLAVDTKVNQLRRRSDLLSFSYDPVRRGSPSN